MTATFAKVRKAALVLDMKGDVLRAVDLLHEAVSISNEMEDIPGGIEARVFMLDLAQAFELDTVNMRNVASEVLALSKAFDGDRDLIALSMAKLEEITGRN